MTGEEAFTNGAIGSQSTQFLMKRIDPTQSNAVLIHSLMGEVYESPNWVRIAKPVIRDTSLLIEIDGMINSVVNPESRLANIQANRASTITANFATNLNKLLFLKADTFATKKIFTKDKKQSTWQYVDDELNTEHIYDEDKLVKNPKYMGKATAVDIKSVGQIVMALGNYVYLNLTRPVSGKEAELISQIVQFREQIHTQTNNNSKGLFGLGGK